MAVFFILKIMENEIWKDVVGFESFYQVSDLGRVRRRATGYVLNGYIRNNYLCVNLNNKKISKTRPIHQLVTDAFIDKDYKKKGLVVDHIDRNKMNNTKYNLRVVTQRVNMNIGKAESGLLGAYKVGNRYHSKILYNQISVNLGCFKTKEEAHEAHKEATLEIETGCFSVEKTKERVRERQKYRGVRFRKDIKKWTAIVKINYKNHNVGVFYEKEDAYLALCDYKKSKGIEF